jgi:hypothetical protein
MSMMIILNGLILNIEEMVQLHNWAIGKKGYLPTGGKDLSSTALPLSLLSWMLGFKDRWKNSREFFLERGNSRVFLTLDSCLAYLDEEEYILPFPPHYADGPILIPLQLLVDHFSVSASWDNSSTLRLDDPLTVPFYRVFRERHSISQLQDVLLYDLNNDGENEGFFVYLSQENRLSLAIISGDGTWLLDTTTSSIHTNHVSVVTHGNDRLYLLNAKDDVQGQHHSLYVYTLENKRALLCNKFTVDGYFPCSDHSVQIIQRLTNNYRYGRKTILRWDEEKKKLVTGEVHLVDYISGLQFSNLQDPEDVARSFCHALADNHQELAQLYCSEGIDRFTLHSLLEYHSGYHPGLKDQLHINVWKRSPDKLVFWTYYTAGDLEHHQGPNRIIRMVLVRESECWKIQYLANLRDTLPTFISWEEGVDIRTEEKNIYTRYPLYTLALGEEGRVRITLTAGKCQVLYNLACPSLEIGEMLPGVHLAFYSPTSPPKKLCFLESLQAKRVHIKKAADNCYDIKITCEEG